MSLSSSSSFNDGDGEGEFAPLAAADSSPKNCVDDSRSDTDNRRRPRNNNNFFSNFLLQKQSSSSHNINSDRFDDNDVSFDNSHDDSGDGGYTYKHTRLRNNGYCTIDDDNDRSVSSSNGGAGAGRVSMHDDWDFNSSMNDGNNTEDGEEEEGGGEFVSYWRQSSDTTDDSNDSAESDDQKNHQPQHYDINNNNAHTSNNHDDEDDDRDETTVRPIPLLYRQYQGGCNTSNNMTTNSFSISRDANNFGSWFNRELGLNNDRDRNSSSRKLISNGDANQEDEALRRSWGFGRRRRRPRQTNNDASSSSNENNEVDREEYVLYSAPSMDGGASSHSSIDNGEHGSFDNIGYAMPTQTIHRPQSPTVNNSNNTNFAGNDRIRRGEGLLSLPIIRPFLRGSHQGFSDQKDVLNSNVADEDESNDDVNNLPSKEDRAIMMKSISDGIPGSNNNDPILQNNASASPVDNTNGQANTSHPNLLDRIFLTRFIQIPNRNEKSLLIQLHHLIRKEDWSLATELLESKPVLARRWHPVERLYGGRFDGEALPIHAACALRPPASFLQMLGSIHPEGLMQKEKSFGRTPLHIACRSLAEASVINVLCEMEPRSVMEKDKLRRVPLHYMIRNYDSFGEDEKEVEDEDVDEDTDDESADESTNNQSDCKKEPDGIVAFNHLVETNADCVKVADHRGWIPLHVACNTSFRHGMINVMKILIELWPESVLAMTEKNSDVFVCVDMGGTFAMKEKVVELLKEAKHKVETSEEGDEEGGEYSSVSDASDLHAGNELESSSEGQDVEEDIEMTPHSSDVVVGNLIELDSFDICEGDQDTDDNSGCLPLFDADSMHPQVIQTAQEADADTFAANAQESEKQLSNDSVKAEEEEGTCERETSREIGGNSVEHDS